MGFSARPLTRYTRKSPSSRTSTRPPPRRTLRVLEPCGWPRPSRTTRSPTGRSPSINASRMSRRRGSATALNTSAVVAARAMHHIVYRYRYVSSEDELGGLQGQLELRAVAHAVEDHPVRRGQLPPVAGRGARPRQQLVRRAPDDPHGAARRIERPVVLEREGEHPRRLAAGERGGEDLRDQRLRQLRRVLDEGGDRLRRQ